MRLRLAAAVALAVVCPASARGQVEFPEWLDGLRREARERGIGDATVQQALAGVARIPRVLELQDLQPEQTLSYAEYERRVVPEARVREGQRLLDLHRTVLDEIGARHGVQSRFIVALWGVESDYGRRMGDLPAVAALATLAHGGRRREFFRQELLALLAAIDAGWAPPTGLTSSWAGALGQCQFMPSNLRFAVDHDGDGRRDIWSTRADVFASIARFLAQLGWEDEETWGRPVRVPAGFDPRLAGEEVRMTLSRWQAFGVRRLDGAELPDRDLWCSLLLPDGPSGPAFLIYDDFAVLMRWNRSVHFGLAVGHLADALR